jgi:hypothetical protein
VDILDWMRPNIAPQALHRLVRFSGLGKRLADSMGWEVQYNGTLAQIMTATSSKSVRSNKLTAWRKAMFELALDPLFGIVVLLCPHASLAQHSLGQPSGLTRQITSEEGADLYGLYYAACDEQSDCPALVISGDGKPIPPKGNDPDAPTHPGLHIGQRLFPFAQSSFSPRAFTFRTARVGQTAYSFQGRFGRENVDVISNVPYLVGVLTETRNGRVVSKKKVHFGHAVIL